MDQSDIKEKNYTVLVKSPKYKQAIFLSIESSEDSFVFTDEKEKMKLISENKATEIIDQLEKINDAKISNTEDGSTGYIGTGNFTYHAAKVEYE
ncbi:hypothetical protein [Enterococcus sp. DIV2324]|uniref:hypothetical protein n=1 Tax=Enterococcus sp. DIV2324 TaxID=2774763 RepID=UPI003F202ADB